MWKIIWKYTKIIVQSSPIFFAGYLLFVAFCQLMQFGMSFSLAWASDAVLKVDNFRGIAVPFLLFFVTMMLGGNTGNMNQWLTAKYTQKAKNIFKKQFMYFAYQKKQDAYYDSAFYDHYEFVKKHIDETTQVTVKIFNNLLSSVIGIAITIGTLTFFHPMILGVLLFISIIMLVINGYIIRKKLEIEKNYTEEERKAEYYSSLMSDKKHAKELRIFAMGNFLEKKWENSYKKFAGKQCEFLQKTLVLSGIPQVLQELLSGVLILFFLKETMKGKLTVGAFVLLYNMMWGLTWRISNMIEIVSKDLAESYQYMAKYEELIGETEAQEQNSSKKIQPFEKLEAKNLSYAYPQQEGKAVDSINFSIRKGEIVAILGYNGSGKSTLSKLLCGLLEDYEGEVLFNGKNIREMDSETLYANFGIGFQDFTRYSISLKENVAIGCIEKQEDEAEIQKAIKKGNLEELIEKLPMGIKTILGKEYAKEGEDLSGGQWQRIILSRAYMGNPPILILDEPTASIDPLGEMRMLQNFREILEGKTAILISHRIGLARMCDRICLIEKGKIVEEGTHEELLKKEGAYAEIYHSQKTLYEEMTYEERIDNRKPICMGGR